MALPTSPPPAMVISTFSADTGGFGQSCETVAPDDTEYEENRTDFKDWRSSNSCLILTTTNMSTNTNLHVNFRHYNIYIWPRSSIGYYMERGRSMSIKLSYQ